MTKISTLVVLLFSVILVGKAQFVPTINSELVHTYTGTINEVKPYANGVLVLGNNGTDDVVVSSTDGTNYSIAESLVSQSASEISAWAQSDKGFYYGNKSSDIGDVDLRVINNGTSSLLLNGGNNSLYPALTNAIKVDYGVDGVFYYYLGKGDFDVFKGTDVRVWETDGTDNGTFELAHDVGFLQSIQLDYAQENGSFQGVMFNGSLHFVAARSKNTAIFKINFGSSTVTQFTQDGGETYPWANLVATDDYLYATAIASGIDFNPLETSAMSAFDSDGTETFIKQLNFANVQPLSSNNKVFAIEELNLSNVRKLAIINNPDDVTILNINSVGETDAIDKMVLSGNKLFFTATPTGGTPNIYAIRTDVDNPQIVMVKDLYGYELRSMIATPEGIAYAYWDESGAAGSVFISQGFISSEYQLNHGTFSFGKVKDLVVNGNTLFVAEENALATDVNIWSHDLSNSSFVNGSLQFTITDTETTAVIPNATIGLDNGLEVYELTTNSSGVAVVMDIPKGNYTLTVSADGYITNVNSSFWVAEPSAWYNPEKEVSLDIDNSTGINDRELMNTNVYPNPTYGTVHIESTLSIAKVKVYNLAGSCVKSIQETNISTVDMSNLPGGVYVMVITETGGSSYTTKLTKK